MWTDGLPFISHLCYFICLFVYLFVCFVSFIIHSQQNVDSKVGRQITFYWPAWLQEHNKPWNEIVWKIDENVYFNVQTETFFEMLKSSESLKNAKMCRATSRPCIAGVWILSYILKY